MWYLIFRRGEEGDKDDMQSTLELAKKHEVLDQFVNAQTLEQQEESLRVRNNVTSGATTESDAMNSINDVNLQRGTRALSQKVMPSVRKYLSGDKVTHERLEAENDCAKEADSPVDGLSWEAKIGEVLCATRIDPDTGKVIDSAKRKEKLESVPAMLKRYKGMESKLLINYFKKYKVPKEEG